MNPNLSRFISLTWVFLLCWAPASKALDCSPNDIELASQVEIDNFQSLYGPCDEIIGDLRIHGLSVESLVPLSSLTKVGGYFLLDAGPLLTSLDGLSGIVSIGGDLDIGGNHALENVDGLSSLVTVGTLRLWGLPALQNLDGFSNLETVKGSLEIIQLDSQLITALSGFEGLVSIGANLLIQLNPWVTTVKGFSNLEVLDSLVISHNMVVEEISGFDSLTLVRYLEIDNCPELLSIGGFLSLSILEPHVGSAALLGGLSIQSNDLLEDLGAFQNLQQISGSTALSHLYALQNLNAFSSLEAVSGDELSHFTLSSNHSLRSLSGLNGLKFVDGDLEIQFNNGLRSLHGLEQIEHVGGYLDIRQNPGLLDCTPLQTLLDELDDYQPGPSAGDVPDVGKNVVFWGQNGSCGSKHAILDQIFVSSYELY